MCSCVGQVHSWNMCRRLRVSPRSFCVDKGYVRACHVGIIRALVMLEGVLPPSQLNPGMHHFVHYAQYTLTHGSLRLFWMMGFERFNKYLKNLVRNNQHPEVGAMCASVCVVLCIFDDMYVRQRHLANAATLNAASAYLTMTGKREIHYATSCCVVDSTMFTYVPTSKEIADLRMIGCAVDEFDIQGFHVANIMGVQFRAGKE